MTDKNMISLHRVVQFLLVVSCLLPAWADGDVSAVVDSVERLRRTERLAAYEAAMIRRGVAAQFYSRPIAF